jgi:hypothetical protein
MTPGTVSASAHDVLHPHEPSGPSIAHDLRATRAVAQSALVVIVGILISGPIALLVVAAIHPQPPWETAERFGAEFHWIQRLPYLGGFLLIGGCVALIASLHAVVPREYRARANAALALAAAFAALIFLNYVVQTTFVPALVRPYRRENDVLVGALAMANPRSLAWALEMWGYAVFGAATWAISCAFQSTTVERFAAFSYVVNGVLGVVGAVATMLSPAWALTAPGIGSFIVWNAWMIVMATVTVIAMRRRPRSSSSARRLRRESHERVVLEDLRTGAALRDGGDEPGRDLTRVDGAVAAQASDHRERERLGDGDASALTGPALAAFAVEEARVRDAQPLEAEGRHVALGLALDAEVERHRPLRGADRGDQAGARGSGVLRESCGGHGVVMIDLAERLAAAGQLHRGAQAQISIVDPEIERGEPVEVDHVYHEPRIGRSLGGAADEDVHALDVGPGAEELDAM